MLGDLLKVSKRVLIVGGGIIGLCVAYYCARKGHAVTVLERGQPERDGCSFANAGMIVPSHFVPLASPGIVQMGLRWMWNPESPFHVQPRFSGELLDWGWKLYRAATSARVAAAAPVLRDLHLASRACYQEWVAHWGNDFELSEHGLLMLCKTEHLDAAKRRGLVAPVAVNREWTRLMAGGSNSGNLWRIVNLELWCQRFIDGPH